ncbi:MAG: hypothetical protein QM498_15210 [Desulfobacterium sp.]
MELNKRLINAVGGITWGRGMHRNPGSALLKWLLPEKYRSFFFTALAALVIRFRLLREKIFDTEAILAKIGAGASVEAFIKQATEVNADELLWTIS